MMSDRLRVLDELGRELSAALARESAATARRPVGRTLAIALAAALLLVGVAFAASYALTGSAIPGARGADVPPEATPRPGSAQLVDLQAEDPASDAPPWTLRLSTSQTGQLCAAVGQEVKEEFGLVGLDGRFRRLPLLGVDACAAREGPPPALIGSRIFDAERPEDVRTMVYGVAGTGLREATVTAGGERRELELGAGGSFIAAYRGYVEDVRPEVALRFEGDGARTFAFGRLEEASAPDPEGGPPWVVDATPRAGGDRDGQTCAQVRQARGRDGGGFGGTPPVCGDLDRAGVFLEVAPFPRRSDLSGDPGPFMWSATLARTVLWGAADETVEAVSVLRGDRRTEVDLSAEGPGFVAVFPAGTEPEELLVEVRRRDGTTTTHRGGINLLTAEGEPLQSDFRRPVRPPLLPPPAAPEPGEPGDIPERFEHDEDSVRIEARSEAASGPDWALRTWRARERDGGRRVVCAQVGRVDGDGKFGLPAPGGKLRSLEVSQRDAAACAAPGQEGQPERRETFLDDPLAYAPEPIATVVWGLAGEDAERVDVRGPWGERSAEPTERGGFLVVAEPRLLDTEAARIYVRTRDGGTGTSRNPGFTPAQVVQSSVRIDARSPDPAGLQPWAVQLWRTEGSEGFCREEGRLVAGRIGTVSLERGTFSPFPMYEGADCPEDGIPAGPGGLPVSFNVTSSASAVQQSDAEEAARVRRRILPGRTTISGIAADGVRTVTVRTPRDVRTLRPAPGGTFLVVYDGMFVGSTEVEVTATLEDGRTVSGTLPLMP
jgi:hypothetical protein